MKATTMKMWCLALASLAFAGCGADTSADDEDGDDEDVPESQAQELRVVNPVKTNCADPSVMRDGATYYLTCTGGDGKGNLFPIYTSTNLKSWTRAGEVFKKGATPAWANGNYWAPELHHVEGGYIAVFSAKSKANGKNVVGVAKGASPSGPFTDKGAPLFGSAGPSRIDAHVVSVDGKPILYWKTEEFQNGRQADTIRAAALTANGMALAGDTREVMRFGEGWEHGVVEGPWVIKRGSFYYLFYSGAFFCNDTYGVGVARSKSPFGPFEKKGAPILKSGERWLGPGHNAVTRGPDNQLYAVYHAYKKSEGIPRCEEPVTDNDARHTLIDRIVFKSGWPTITSRL